MRASQLADLRQEPDQQIGEDGGQKSFKIRKSSARSSCPQLRHCSNLEKAVG